MRFIDPDGMGDVDKVKKEKPKEDPLKVDAVSGANNGSNSITVVGNKDFVSQYDSQFGDSEAQKQACSRACDAISAKIGVTSTKENLIQTAEENADHTALKTDSKKAKEGVDYIKGQIKEGKPVKLGVNHTLNMTSNEMTTDHFVEAVGIGYDASKKQDYIRFMEVGSTVSGTDSGNRLYIDPNTNTMSGNPVYNINRQYIVTQVRRNVKQ